MAWIVIRKARFAQNMRHCEYHAHVPIKVATDAWELLPLGDDYPAYHSRVRPLAREIFVFPFASTCIHLLLVFDLDLPPIALALPFLLLPTSTTPAFQFRQGLAKPMCPAQLLLAPAEVGPAQRILAWQEKQRIVQPPPRTATWYKTSAMI
jgi:hypothetical protein